MLSNPFHELYAGETASDNAFVELFSPVLLPHVSALYRPGNVALIGSQGNGKSMLLTLLKPEVRLAYAAKGLSFPLTPPYSTFVGAGINIVRSPAKDFGLRVKDERVAQQLPLLFGDFLNYWIVQDTLASVVKLIRGGRPEILEELRMHRAETELDRFACALSADESWFGYLLEVRSFDGLVRKIAQRLRSYKEFINFNVDELPSDIGRTVTSVGTCVTRTAELLRENQVIGDETGVYVRIDQVDSLVDLADTGSRYAGDLLSFRHVINKFLGVRDSVVSYRIGARPYAWGGDMLIYGTPARLEKNRDYTIVDLDGTLRRSENPRTWVFPSFAEDMFRRRLALAKFEVPKKDNALNFVFGGGELPKTRARQYVKKKPARLLRRIEGVDESINDELFDLAEEEPFVAKLLEAWIRQKGDKPRRPDLAAYRADMESKPYWQKERTQQALLQIAARQQQRLVWAGKWDLIQLSSYNTLSMLRLYRGIWDAWLQEERDSKQTSLLKAPKEIPPEVQSAGILAASEELHEKLGQETGSGVLMRLADVLGAHFRTRLLADVSMSNPGENGFSIAVEELERLPRVQQLIEDASDFGVLTRHRHTTKNRDRRQRDKFYLNALLSPYYQIPANHTKEPEYIGLNELLDWLREASLLRGGSSIAGREPSRVVRVGQPTLEDLFDA